MLLQFKTLDDAVWICDTQFLTYARVSAPSADQQSQVIEHGKLVPQGFGVYALEGRRRSTPGPGAGLCSIGMYIVGIGATIKIMLRTNTPIKDFTMPAPIRQILYEILPTDPKQLQNSIEEMSNAQGSEATEPVRNEATGPQEPEVGGILPETTPRTEQQEAETSMERGNEELVPPIDQFETPPQRIDEPTSS